jgi:hypothetical protein
MGSNSKVEGLIMNWLDLLINVYYQFSLLLIPLTLKKKKSAGISQEPQGSLIPAHFFWSQVVPQYSALALENRMRKGEMKLQCGKNIL